MQEEIKQIIVRPSVLTGQVKVSGGKNSVLRLMAASLLSDETITLHNYPATLLDAIVHKEMLEALGKDCQIEGQTLIIAEKKSPDSTLHWSGRSIRNTLLILGALVARTGYEVLTPFFLVLAGLVFVLNEIMLVMSRARRQRALAAGSAD